MNIGAKQETSFCRIVIMGTNGKKACGPEEELKLSASTKNKNKRKKIVKNAGNAYLGI
jgi:hypothetical protein